MSVEVIVSLGEELFYFFYQVGIFFESLVVYQHICAFFLVFLVVKSFRAEICRHNPLIKPVTLRAAGVVFVHAVCPYETE